MLKIDFAFDLGTESIRIYKEGKKIEEFPSFDEEMKSLLVKEGKICHFNELEQKLRAAVKKHTKLFLGFIWVGKRNALMVIPGEENSVNMRAFREQMEFMGFTSGYMIYDYLVAAAGLGIDKKGTYMIVDSGAGKTRITTIDQGDLMQPYSSSVTEMAGNSLNEAICVGLSHEFDLQITDADAESLKRDFGFAEVKYITIKGTDKLSGNAKEVTITSELYGWLRKEAEFLRDKIRQHYELLPPEIQQEIQKKGIYLVGKNFRLKGLVDLIAMELPVSPLSYQFSHDYMEEGLSYIQQHPDQYLPYMLE